MHPLLAVVLLLPALASAEDLGERIATAGNGQGVAPCTSCHGAQGQGAATFPALANMDAGYLETQLLAIRDGGRASPVMSGAVATLSDDEAKAVAGWFAALPPPPPAGPPPSEDQAQQARALVELGDWAGRDLPSCDSCHGPGARGAGAIPPLAAQQPAYLDAQLRAFRDGGRQDPGALMSTVAGKLSDEEIQALTAWLAAQPGGAQ